MTGWKGVANFVARCIIVSILAIVAAPLFAFISFILLAYDSGDATHFAQSGGATVLFLIYTVMFVGVTATVFLIPIKPIFSRDAGFALKIAVILAAVATIVVVALLIGFYRVYEQNTQETRSQNQQGELQMVEQYVRDNKTELRAQFPDGCFDVVMPGFRIMKRWYPGTFVNNNEQAYQYCVNASPALN
ncbi:MAG: hypothetical protein KBD06_03340 [Candidatus Pacebacteria bacterium]|nr:hypothetical protein [Candidatus Paceibacterota bacterium]